MKQALVQWLKNQSVLVSGSLNVNGEKDRMQLDSSTVCDLLSAKMNIDNPCYSNRPLMTTVMLVSAIRQLQDEA